MTRRQLEQLMDLLRQYAHDEAPDRMQPLIRVLVRGIERSAAARIEHTVKRRGWRRDARPRPPAS